MESIVISLGGSIILSDDVDHTYFHNFIQTIQKIAKKFKIYLVIGGGKTARQYIKIGRKQGLSEEQLDELGIKATRLNASLLSMLLMQQDRSIPTTTDEAVSCDDSIVIMGGTLPGHSTDFVGAELAYKTHAWCYIIATNVDGVYTKDPNKYPDAKHLSSVSIDTLLEQYGSSWNTAGKNMVIDGPALQIIKDYQIQTYVINGKDLPQFKNIINKKDFKGTIIKN
jgi:uridylate kinase